MCSAVAGLVGRLRGLLSRSPPEQGDGHGQDGRCSCGHPQPTRPLPEPHRSERVDDYWAVERVEETDVAYIHHQQRVIEYRCLDCGETFDYRPAFATQTDVEWKEGHDA